MELDDLNGTGHPVMYNILQLPYPIINLGLVLLQLRVDSGPFSWQMAELMVTSSLISYSIPRYFSSFIKDTPQAGSDTAKAAKLRH